MNVVQLFGLQQDPGSAKCAGTRTASDAGVRALSECGVFFLLLFYLFIYLFIYLF